MGEKRKNKIRAVFEDGVISVLDKPSGIVVNRVETVKRKTVQDWIEENFKSSELLNFKAASDFVRRSGIVHRLDKETSGLLVVAKTPAAFKNLQAQFKARRVVKRYLTLVHGRVSPERGVIQAAIARNPLDRKKFGVFLGGRKAETRYKLLSIRQKVSGKGRNLYSLLEVEPKTGRTHQIRVHLKHIGHAIVGDTRYAGRKAAKADRQWCPRQFLHASYLSFVHPKSGQAVEFVSPLPMQLKRVLQTLPRTVRDTAGFTLLV